MSGCRTQRAELCRLIVSPECTLRPRVWSCVVRGDLPYLGCVIFMGLVSIGIIVVAILMQ